MAPSLFTWTLYFPKNRFFGSVTSSYPWKLIRNGCDARSGLQ